MSYWVVGGGSTKILHLKRLKNGEELKKFGPFETYDLAKKEWDKVSWQNVDLCNVRYIILPHK